MQNQNTEEMAKKKATVRLVDENSKQLIFDTSEAIGKTLKVSVNGSKAIEIPIVDQLTICPVAVPDSYSLDFQAV